MKAPATANTTDGLFLASPSTLHLVPIPDPPPALEKYNNKKRLSLKYGFGYDAHSSDYKIVCLSYYDKLFNPNWEDAFIYVYSRRSGLWERVGTSPYDHSVCVWTPSGVFLNGAVHWVVGNRDERQPCLLIAAFDLATQEFRQLPAFPNPYDGTRLAVFEGSLIMIQYPTVPNGPHAVWIMERYGVGDSWIRRLSVSCNSVVKVLHFVGDGDGEVVLTKFGGKLVVCGRGEGEARDVVENNGEEVYGEVRDVVHNNGEGVFVLDGVTFLESLIEPVFRPEV